MVASARTSLATDDHKLQRMPEQPATAKDNAQLNAQQPINRRHMLQRQNTPNRSSVIVLANDVRRSACNHLPIIKSSDLVPSSSDPGLCPFPALGPDDVLELVHDRMRTRPGMKAIMNDRMRKTKTMTLTMSTPRPSASPLCGEEVRDQCAEVASCLRRFHLCKF